MTTRQAAELRVRSSERKDSSKCEHLNLKLEWSDSGYLTGNYSCIVCGIAVVQKPN